MTAETANHTLTITVDPALNEVFNGKTLFPEKLAEANEFLAKHPFPERLKKPKR